MTDLSTALDGDLRTVVELASLAPSVHNTQPWRFGWDGTSLSVYEDRTRGLPALDPDGRERRISCGAAVLMARVAFAELGYVVRTDLPAQDELVAVLTVDGRGAPGREDHALAQAIPRRTTDREPFADRPVPADVRAELVGAAEREGAWARFVDDDSSGGAVELQVLLSHADAAQRSDPDYLAELAAWRRSPGVDGVPVRALPTVPVEQRGSSWAMRDFDPGVRKPPHADESADPRPAEHPVVLVLGTPGDTPGDWLVAGQALGRVLLLAAVHYVAAQPLTQVLEVPALRARVRHALGVLGHPQMLLRVGYGHSGPTSRRRPPEETVTVVPRAG